MRSQSWLRSNWPWAVGGAFVTVHLFTWIMQKAMKSSVQSERQVQSELEHNSV
uniref:Uncharacterized protein n=1 Tax=Periophthalmus magnuspinnatus TaxID=409849 RepID=A0A3B4A8E3_9GOBI